jgi:hypothetical protein
MDIEHLNNNVVVMYLETKNATTTRKWKKMGSHLETFTLKVEDCVQ